MCAGTAYKKTSDKKFADRAEGQVEPGGKVSLKGDVNGDGKVDVDDAIMLKEYLLGKINSMPCPENAYMNDDTAIDIYDLSLLKSLLL